MNRFALSSLSALMAAAALFLPLTAGRTAQATEVVSVSQNALEIEADKGALVRLDGAASTVFIANPEIADVQVKSPRLVYVLGKKPGETTLYAVDRNDKVLVSQKVSVSHNISRLQTSIGSLLPDATINVRSVDGTLVLSGEAGTAREVEDARRLATQLVKDEKELVTRVAVTAPNQVNLRVRVAEVSRDVLKTFGINWDAIYRSTKFLFGIATGSPVLAGGVFGAGSSFLVRNSETNSLVGSYNNGRFDLNTVIDALDNEGLISVLAEPNLTALSGQQAKFLAGGEFPILVPEKDRTGVEFKQFGVSLAFTPTVLSPNRISLKVNPEVSELTTTGAVEVQGFTIPALTTRRVETTVELGSGQSFVIAGLLQNNTNHDVNKFPGLGDLPVLGTLFRSDQFRRNETELVIIVTPYIVRPVSSKKIASPTDGLTPPSDLDRILRGRVYRPNLDQSSGGKTHATEGHVLSGPAGFVLN